jgi:pimeloyl-ACP methyl ester carboxylesterase
MNMHRAVLRSILLVLPLSIGNLVLAQSAQAPAVAKDQRMLPYAQPGQLVDIGGRRINMQCAGTGKPTVVLMAGIFSWSLVWYKTQPVIAQNTRVCAFDRASYGFSDPAPRPQIMSDVVADLHKVLHSGAIPGPFVLVGHSLGGLEARVYAERWPEDVVGMVLVDSSPAGEMLLEVSLPDYDEAEGRESYAAYTLQCALAVARRPLEPSMPEYKECSSVDALPSDTPAAIRRVWSKFFTADYFADKVSLMSSLYTHRYDSADHRSLGAMPLVVLTAKNTWGDSPAAIRFTDTFLKYWLAQHEAFARLSSRGVHRYIKDSNHHIQLDQPQAVIDAVNEVVNQVHAGTKS